MTNATNDLYSTDAPYANGDSTLLFDASPSPILPAADDTTPLAPVDLHRIGYEKAEQHRGNALALENLLNRVLRGYLVDERNDDSRRKVHEDRIDKQLLSLEKQAEAARTQIRKINGADLPALREEISHLDEEILQIRRDEAAGLRKPDHSDRLQLRMKGIGLLLFTAFVYLFYVSAFYSAFYRDLSGELQAPGANQIGVLSAIFASAAFHTFDFHWAGPILLFGFGLMLHILFEMKTRIGRLLLGLLVCVIAITDGLIAHFVETKTYEMKVLMGMADAHDHAWWASPVFWLVMAMGFVAAMVWSGLLHAWMHEVGKKDTGRIVALEIAHRKEKQRVLKGRINDLTASLTELEGQISRIDLDSKAVLARRQSVVFSPSELEKYVTDFYDGWLLYINNRMGNDATSRDACHAVIKTFYALHLAKDNSFSTSIPN